MTKAEAENFYQEHKIDVVLTVATADGRFLVKRNEEGGLTLPSRPLWKAYTSRACAEMFLHDLTGLRAGEYVLIRQVGFLDHELDRVRAVLYATEIAEPVPLLDSRYEWVDSETLYTNGYVAGVYLYACQYKRF
jgi:hypothetical protein